MSNGFVKLKSAHIIFGGFASQTFLSASVKVKNVAYRKDVQIRFGTSGQWQDAPLTWIANYNNYDLFELQPAPWVSYPSVEFAIRYTPDMGETYWDNNNFANYSPRYALTGASNVILNSANLVYCGTAGSSYITGIQGEILVNNLSFHKRVGIRHSGDGFLSYVDIGASYNGSLGGSLESWRFGRNTTPVSFGTGQFAVYYQNLETGQYYWDNNFGQNYSISTSSFNLA
jgi:hypothetical protein